MTDRKPTLWNCLNLGVAALALLLAAWPRSSAPPADNNSPAESLNLRKLTIVDHTGRPAIVLESDPLSSGVQILGADDVARASLQLDHAGNSTLVLSNDVDLPSFRASATADGTSNVNTNRINEIELR